MTKQKIYYLSLLAIACLAMSCQSPSKQSIVKNLNGYWKIDNVKKTDGSEVVYKGSPAVDYIQVDSTLNGFRVKLQPKINGTFETSRDKEYFQIKQKNDTLRFYYKTAMTRWSEALLSISKDQFKVKDSLGMVYTYKRFESLQKELKAHGKH